jgi:CHAD domain-containing protein
MLADDPLAEAARKVFGFHFAQMLFNEEGTRLGEDIEALHDMRVATRRLRAAFELFAEAFEPKALGKHLRGLKLTGRTLGAVRDMDVLLEHMQQAAAAMNPDEAVGLEPLLAEWQAERERRRAALLAYLDSPRYERFKIRFIQFVSTPGMGAAQPEGIVPATHLVRDQAPLMIYSRLSAVRAFEPILATATLEQLHALRIDFKKLRYAVEFFREILGPQSKKVIDIIKKVQDHLGELNDARVTCLLLDDFLKSWEQRQSSIPLAERRSPMPVFNYLALRQADLYRLMSAFPQTWDEFNQPEVRRALALAISEL